MRASAEKFTHTHADIHCMKVSSSCCDSLVLTHSHVLASGTSRFRLQSAMQPKGIHSNEWKTKKMGGKKEEENNEVWSEARSERVNLLKWTRKWAGGGGTGGGGTKEKWCRAVSLHLLCAADERMRMGQSPLRRTISTDHRCAWALPIFSLSRCPSMCCQ